MSAIFLVRCAGSAPKSILASASFPLYTLLNNPGGRILAHCQSENSAAEIRNRYPVPLLNLFTSTFSNTPEIWKSTLSFLSQVRTSKASSSPTLEAHHSEPRHHDPLLPTIISLLNARCTARQSLIAFRIPVLLFLLITIHQPRSRLSLFFLLRVEFLLVSRTKLRLFHIISICIFGAGTPLPKQEIRLHPYDITTRFNRPFFTIVNPLLLHRRQQHCFLALLDTFDPQPYEHLRCFNIIDSHPIDNSSCCSGSSSFRLD